MSEESREGIRVLLVDDHDSFRRPLAFMLEREPDISVVAQAASVAQAFEGEDVAPDVIVVDLDLTDGSGVELISELRSQRSEALTLALSDFSEPGLLAHAVDAGAAGVMHKSSSLREIVQTIRRLHSGEQLLSRNEIREAVRTVSRERAEEQKAGRVLAALTPREREMLRALAEGLGDREISGRLGIGVGTVRTHMSSLLSKLGADSRLQALVIASRYGVVEIG